MHLRQAKEQLPIQAWPHELESPPATHTLFHPQCPKHPALHHKNLICFCAVKTKAQSPSTQLWRVTLTGTVTMKAFHTPCVNTYRIDWGPRKWNGFNSQGKLRRLDPKDNEAVLLSSGSGFFLKRQNFIYFENCEEFCNESRYFLSFCKWRLHIRFLATQT